MTSEVGFRHGALSDDYEVQANEQGFTLGTDAAICQRLGDALVLVHIHGLIPDSQYGKSLQKLTNKLGRSCRPLESRMEGGATQDDDGKEASGHD